MRRLWSSIREIVLRCKLKSVYRLRVLKIQCTEVKHTRVNTLSMETCLDTGRGPSHSHLYSFKTTKEYMLITSSMLDPHGTIYMIWLISRRICHRPSPGLNPSMANLGITCMYVVCRPYFKPVLKYFWLIDCLLLILVFFLEI